MRRFVLVFLTCTLWAQNGLFVETDPFGASIAIDGRPRTEKTPALLRDVPPGVRRIVVYRDGFRSAAAEVRVPVHGFLRLRFEMPRTSLAVNFAEEEEVDLLGQRRQGRRFQYRLEEGGYRVLTSTNPARVEPVFADEGALTVAAWLLPVSLGVAVGLTIRDLNWPWMPSFLFSPATLSSYALLGFNLGWYLGLEHRRQRFQAQTLLPSEPLHRGIDTAANLFRRAQVALEANNLLAARDAYSRLLLEHPQSPYAAQALFALSRLALVRGELEEARSLCRILLDLYPVQEVYDRTVKTLADLAYDRGDREETKFWLNLLTFSDESVSREEVQPLKAWAEEAP